MKQANILDRPITIDEASDHYPDEWVFMRVTACTEHDTPTEGIVVAHSRRRGSLNLAIIRALSTAREESADYLLHSPNVRSGLLTLRR
jgi:hypothetical protein